MKAGYLIPINSTAARVVSRGEHFEFSPYQASGDSDLPLPIRPITQQMRDSLGFTDLTGMVVGRLKVVGLAEGKPGRWVCKCACGTYTVRKGRSIREGTVASSPCDQCYQLAVAKKRDHFRRTGKHRGSETFLV